MTYTPWNLLVDVGVISALLMLGKLLRSRVRFVQKLFLPPSLIAGIFALVLGPEVLGWVPLSSQTGTYASVLIALVFSCLPLTSRRESTGRSSSVKRMWVYSQAGMLLQWGLGASLGLFLLSPLWGTSPSFGLAMPAGYCGGHGTAAAIGEAFSKYGVQEMQSIAMTAATVGIIAAVVIGMWAVNWGTEKGYTAFLSRFSELPPELKTGILPKDKRQSMGEASFSAISLDSLTFNFAIVGFIALCGYGISKAVALIWPALMLPVFSCSFLAGLLVAWAIRKVNIGEHVSKPIVGHLSGAFTDYLVAFGVASIKLSLIVEYWLPLLVLLLVGLILTALYVFYLGRRIHKEYWFEKSLFTWGWFTGTMAMGIALLRITDPESKSRCLDDYALAYLYIAPVEIALVTFAPVAFCGGYGLLFTLICLCLGAGILLFSRKLVKDA